MRISAIRVLAFGAALGLGLGCGKSNDAPAGVGGSGQAGEATGGDGEVAAGAGSTNGGSSGSAGSAVSGGAGAGSSAGGASAGASGGTAGGGSELLDCDPKKILCKSVAPECVFGQVPMVEGSCYGPCVKVERCACSTAAQCPEPEQYTCWSKQHCGPYVK